MCVGLGLVSQYTDLIAKSPSIQLFTVKMENDKDSQQD